MSSSLVGSTDCILLIKNVPRSFTEANLLARCESIGHSWFATPFSYIDGYRHRGNFYSITLHSQPETGECYTVKLLAPSPEGIQKILTMIDGMRIDQTWISTEVRPWASLHSSERSQYPAHVLLDPGMLQSLRLSLTQPSTWSFCLPALLSPSGIPEKIQDLGRQIADLKVELAGYQNAFGTSGSREKIQVFKLVNEFLRAAKTATPTTYEATTDLLNNITALQNVMSNRDSPPTVPQITSTLSACFVPFFQQLSSTHQAFIATYQELEATKDEFATVKATNEGLQERVSQYSFVHPPHTLLTQSTTLQSEMEALKRELSEEKARLTVATQENKKLRAQNLELKGKVGSFREYIRLSEERHSTPANSGSVGPPDTPMVDSTPERDVEIQVLEWEQELLTRLLEGEKNTRLGVELELANLKVEYELQEKKMIEWFLESVRVTNGEEYLKQLKTLKEIRPMPQSMSRDSFYRLLG